MDQVINRSGTHRIFIWFLCGVLSSAGFLGLGFAGKVNAAVSPLITSYKPQVQNVNVNASYTNSSGNTISGVIHHPGIAITQADLDNMREHARAGDEPWNTAFNAFASDIQSSKTPRIYYESGNDIFVNIRGPWAFTDANGVYWSDPSEYVGTRANTDSETAFKQAVMWYITGDETYRANAMSIIRSYSAIQSVVPHTSFRFATMTYLLAAASEILRYSDTPTGNLKWTAADTANFINMMNLCSVTYNAHTFFMNQHQFGVMGTIARAIFTNDLQLYAEAVEATMVNAAGDPGGRNGSIKYQMRLMTANEITGGALSPSDQHVQLMEMGRDVGHSYADIAGLSTLAQTIYAQGTKVDPVNGTMSAAANAVNPFNFLDDRLLAGTTYALKYHLGYDVVWTPAYSDGYTVGSAHFDNINADGRGRIDAFFSVLYNYYKYVEQRDMSANKYKYLAYAYETRMPEVASKDYPLATLLYTPDAAKTVGMSNQKVLSAITGLSATKAGSSTINLSWTTVQGALGYNLYRSTEPEGGFVKLNSEPITGTAYSNTGLIPNTIYYYKIEVAGGQTSPIISETTGGDGTPYLDASNYTLMVNETHYTRLRAVSADNSSQDLTSQAVYSSSDPAVATVDAVGTVRGTNPGLTTITVTYNGKSYNAIVRVVRDVSLITWYEFDETSGTTAADSSGFGNNATIVGGSNATWTSGKAGNAISLGGTNTTATYVALPGNVIDNLNSMTFAAWVKASNTSDAVSLFTAGPAAAAVPTKYMMMLLNGSRFTMTASGNTAEQNISAGGNLTANMWKHVAVTLSGSTGILYIDGVQAATNTSMTIKPSDLAPTTAGNFIGKSEWTGDKYLKGQIDDFRIYNRALNSSEITSVVSGQNLPTVPLTPSDVSAAATDYSTINLSWSATAGATGYQVFMSESSAVNAIYQKMNTDSITGTSYAFTGLKKGRTYYFYVKSVNALGESSPSAIASATTPNAAPDSSLIIWYRFDETGGTTVPDSSGKGNNGIVIGGSNATWATGKSGNAITFGGASTDAAYVSLPGNLTDDLSSMTFAAWVKSSNTSDAVSLFTAGPAAASVPTKYMMMLLNGSRFTITASGNTSEQSISKGGNLANNTWKHVAVTLSGSTGILYIDGVEAARNSAMTLKPSDLKPTDSGNFIGKSEWTGDKYLKGQVDDFRIYNRAISASEIVSVMNGQTLATPAVPTTLSSKNISGLTVKLN